MKWYLVSYDLNSPGRNYEALYSALCEVDKTCDSLLESVWLVRYNGRAGDLFNALKKALDQNDELFIAEIANNMAWRLPKEKSDWVKNMVNF